MPLIKIELLKGRTLEQKRRIVSQFTKIMCDIAEVEAEKVRIIFSEIEQQNYAISGKLAIDNK